MSSVSAKRISISIDLGTSSCKVCAVDGFGCILGSTTQKYPTYSPHEGWAEQEPEDWLKAISVAVSLLRAQLDITVSSVLAVTLTSAAHIAVLLDASDQPARRALLWSDQRSRREADALRAEYGDFILSHAFNNVSTSWTLPHLVWIRNNEPEIWGSMRRICLSKDFVLQRLTGEWKTDPATAVSSMLYDASEGIWSERLCSMAGIDPRVLPDVVPAGAVVGHVTPGASSLFGLPEGIPVVNGTLDSATETYGADAVREGDFVIRVGTAGGIHVVKASPSPDARLLTYPFPADGLWYSQAGTNSAGSAISWAVSSAGGNRASADYDAFSRTASAAPAGCDGLLFHPYLSGERTPYWDPTLRGTFSGVSFRHGKEHFARAVLEGVAFSLCDAFLAIVPQSSIPDRIRVVGGGTADTLLMDILSTALNRELLVLRGVDSAYGAALFALHCVAARESSGTAQLVEPDRVLPKKENVSLYADVFELYRRSCSYLVRMYNARASR